MFTNYLKTAIRSLLKNKGFTALNVLGLTLGIATCLLIVFYVLDELSYDRYNEKADRIYRVNNEIKFGGNQNVYASSPAPAAQALKNDFPEIEQVVRFQGAGRIRVKKGRSVYPGRPCSLCGLWSFRRFHATADRRRRGQCLKGPSIRGHHGTNCQKIF